ncbi:MAG: helix-turn-helix transcriptional regulator [Frankiaceae bacterium]|jgi:DNA-binding CsgD family transcriptional regulator|nr:helix-turn-helix transcriptional regulator [Frankiaceae bacterium]
MSDVQDFVSDEVAGYLRNSINVDLVGRRLSGRSRVAALVAEQLDSDGMSVMSVTGLSALSDRPFGALALAGVEVPAANAASAMAAVLDSLTKRLPRGRSALIVDDADDLDAVSSGVIAAAGATHGIVALLVTRLTAMRETPGRRLVVEFQPTVRVAVEPLNFGQVNQMVHLMLPGPVDSSLVARIATMSGGLQGLVGAIVDISRRAGSIARSGGIWHARTELWNPRLASAVEPLLTDVSDKELEALTKVSLRGTVSIAGMRQLVSDRMFLRLEACGLLQTTHASSGTLAGVFPPMLREFLLRTSGVSLLVGGHDDQTEDDQLVAGGSRSRPLIGPDPGLWWQHSHGAVFRTRINDHWQQQAESLRSAWLADPSVETAVPLLAALNATAAAPSAFTTVIDSITAEDADSPLVSLDLRAQFATWQAAIRALLFDELDAACADLAARRARTPAVEAQLRSYEAQLQLLAGSLPGPELLAADAAEQDAVGAASLQLMRVATHIAAGRTADALAALPEHLVQDPQQDGLSRILKGLGQVLHGNFAAGADWALSALAGPDAEFNLSELHAHAYVAGLGLVFAGRLDDFDVLANQILALDRTSIFTEHYRVGLFGLAALAAYWRGQPNQMWVLAVQAEAAGHRQGPYPGMAHGVTPLLAKVDDALEEVGQRIWTAVSERLDRGFLAAGLALAVTAVEIWPDPAYAPLISGHARNTQSPFLTAVGNYVVAAATADPEALAASIGQLTDCGARTHAAKAAITCALVLRTGGDIAGSVRYSEAAWEMASQLSTRRLRGMFYRLGAAINLTGRELEVAQMAADGKSSQTIAQACSLSVGTVENNLSNINGKIGCNNRRDLVRALSTWAVFETPETIPTTS